MYIKLDNKHVIVAYYIFTKEQVHEHEDIL